MRTILLVVLAVSSVACVGRSGIEPDPTMQTLAGSWLLDGRQCDNTLTFFGGDAYEIAMTCKGATGAPTGFQVETGTVTANAGRLSFVIEETTCAGVERERVETLTIDGDSISLANVDGQHGTAAYTRTSRIPSPQAFGCWRTGAFVPAPLAPL